ncbi:hypothetical protein [Neotabrizicola sp. sgz301269]|uniref:hypothetical protein n=1 Tax=Neotabrizicola sp. sgz301269 TaxID=3276282 RepID=UPI00376F9E2D
MEKKLPARKADVPVRPAALGEWRAENHCDYCAAAVPAHSGMCERCKATQTHSMLQVLVNWALFIGGLVALFAIAALFGA